MKARRITFKPISSIVMMPYDKDKHLEVAKKEAIKLIKKATLQDVMVDEENI